MKGFQVHFSCEFTHFLQSSPRVYFGVLEIKLVYKIPKFYCFR